MSVKPRIQYRKVVAIHPSRKVRYNLRIPVSVFMLLYGSANRAKSWSCEHGANWLDLKDPVICRTCYWAYPENYTHIAMRPIRRLDILWSGKEVDVYDRLRKRTEQLQQEIPAFVKKIIEKNF